MSKIEVNENENLVQGIATTDKLYTYEFKNDKFYVYYKDEEHMWFKFPYYGPPVIQDIVNGLNEAYQNGYHKCSVELLNEKQ